MEFVPLDRATRAGATVWHVPEFTKGVGVASNICFNSPRPAPSLWGVPHVPESFAIQVQKNEGG